MQLRYRDKVIKQLQKIPKVEQRKIIRKLEFLSTNPTSGKQLQGEYKGHFSLRSWPYRIIYRTEKGSVVVYSIAHRQGAYK